MSFYRECANVASTLQLFFNELIEQILHEHGVYYMNRRHAKGLWCISISKTRSWVYVELKSRINTPSTLILAQKFLIYEYQSGQLMYTYTAQQHGSVWCVILIQLPVYMAYTVSVWNRAIVTCIQTVLLSIIILLSACIPKILRYNTVQYGCIGLSDVDHLRIYSYFDMICRGSLVVFITHLVIRSSVVIEREGATLIITEPIHQNIPLLIDI